MEQFNHNYSISRDGCSSHSASSENSNTQVPATKDGLSKSGPMIATSAQMSTDLLSCLPPVLKDMTLAVAACHSTPIEFALYSALAIHSAAIGKGIQVSYLQHITRPNIYVVLGMPSGTGKSETLRPLIEPVKAVEQMKLDYWLRTERPKLLAKQEWLKLEIDRRKRNPKLERNSFIEETIEFQGELEAISAALRNPYQLISEDASEEAFVEVLAASGECTFSYSADAARPIENILGGMKKKGVGTDESHLLKAFSGDPINKNRITRVAASVASPCASLLWVTTPMRLEELCFNDRLTEGGFGPRTLMALFRHSDKMLTNQFASIPYSALTAWKNHLEALLDEFRYAKSSHTIECDPDATDTFLEFHNRAIRFSDNETVKVYTRRWGEYSVRLGLNLHVAKYGIQSVKKNIELRTALIAVSIAEWMSLRQQEAFGRRYQTASERQREKALNVIKNVTSVENDEISPKQFYSRNDGGSKICEDSSEARSLLDSLQAEGIVSGPHSEAPPNNRRQYYRLTEYGCNLIHSQY